MQPGVHRTDVAYVWPPMLIRPETNVRIVYLDLNHWISLAKAAVGHRDGDRHREALSVLRVAASSGQFVFPLSSTHYMEMAGIADPRQRFDVAGVMEELSGFASLVCRSVLMRLEFEAVLDERSGKRRPQPYAAVPVLGQGVLQAFGKQGGLRIRSDEGDVTDSARLAWRGGPREFDRWQADGERRLDRAVLRGPTDLEAPGLQAEGWDPTVSRRVAQERADAERDQAARFAAEPRWRRGRTRDVVSARHLVIELGAIASEALAARSLTLEDVWGSPESARRLIDAMPSADIAVTLLTAAHRNPQSAWVSNDIFDVDALSVAVPYCDIIVTERHAQHVLDVEGSAARCGSKVVVGLGELLPLVAAG